MIAARRRHTWIQCLAVLPIASLVLLAPTGCDAQHAGSTGGLARGLQLFSQHDLDGAEAALASLPADAPARDRVSALQVRGLLAWRFRHGWDAAERLLRAALALDVEPSGSWAALARLETARKRYDVATDAALEAIASAETRQETAEATAILAGTAIAKAEATFDLTPRDPLDPLTVDWLRASHERLKAAVRENPGDLAMARPLIRTSIFLGDGDALLAAWNSFFLTIVGKPDAGVLEGPLATLVTLLPGWADQVPTASQIGRIVLAMARSGLYREAWLAAQTPGWTRGVEASDPDEPAQSVRPGLNETLVYARFVHDAKALTDEYYRLLSLKEADTRQYRESFLHHAEPLWDAIRWDGERPRLTMSSVIRELDRRFNAEIRGGATAGYQDLHFGHRVIDERISVSQYGHEADLRFVALDGMVSNGFQSWAWDYRAQHGGWARADGMTQVRPAYAGGGQRVWRVLNDSTALRRVQEETARETARDWERAAGNPHAFLPGLQGRLRAQGAQQLLVALRAEGLDEHALKSRFLVAFDAAIFASSIAAHEGRHAIDKRLDSGLSGVDLEFRGKLSEVAFAPHPRLAFGGIISATIGDETPHGRANARVMEGLVSWLANHAAEVPGLDASRPLLPQLDKLSDDQLKVAMASMDPLSR